MTVAEDTEWLRNQLTEDSFHIEYAQQWIAVRDGKVVFSHSENTAFTRWLENNDQDRRCVLAFADDRLLA